MHSVTMADRPAKHGMDPKIRSMPLPAMRGWAGQSKIHRLQKEMANLKVLLQLSATTSDIGLFDRQPARLVA